jgi:hypothetical protein
MSIFWITFIISACITAGILALLIRQDTRRGVPTTITLMDGLLYAFMMFVPWLNIFIAIGCVIHYIIEHGSKHSITFGKGKEPE